MRTLNGKLLSAAAIGLESRSMAVSSIRALAENKRPNAETKLAVAPFWNLSDDGSCVPGLDAMP